MASLSLVICVFIVRSFMATSGTYTWCLLQGSLQTKSVSFSVTSQTTFAIACLFVFFAWFKTFACLKVGESKRGIFGTKVILLAVIKNVFFANKDRAKRQLFDN